MILVDSSVWIDYFNGAPTWQADVLDKALSSVPIVVGDLILTEVLQGFRSDKDYRTAKSLLDAFTFRAMGGYEVAVESARNFRRLRKKGITVRKTIDVVIATFCMIEGLTLLHNDRDFLPMMDYLPLNVFRETSDQAISSRECD